MTPRRQALGGSGEARVARWYVRQGWTVLDRNWRVHEGELDLVVMRDDLLAFCEVKTRSSDRFGHPAEAVGWRKQRRLRQLGQLYLSRWPAGRRRPRHVRFDVAAVIGTRIDVIENAF